MSSRVAEDRHSMVSRAFTLLDAFTDGVDTLGASELARATGLPKPTAYRLATELVRLGVLEAVDGRYRLGLRLFELGHRARGQARLRDLAAPQMSRLRQLTRHAVHLAVLDGKEVVYLAILPGATNFPLPSRVGGRMPAHATAVGKAILSRASREAVADVLSGVARSSRLTPRTIAVPGLLAAELAHAAECGYALDREESSTGLVCVASPIVAGGTVHGALSVSGRSAEVRTATLAPMVRAVAAALGRDLRVLTEAGNRSC